MRVAADERRAPAVPPITALPRGRPGLTLLDTRGDRDYDELSALAAYLCEAPIALVTLVDEDLQWFDETPREPERLRPAELVLSELAVNAEDRLTLIPDLRTVPALAALPRRIAAGEIRFLAGVPLVSSDGGALGALCVMDIRPRSLSIRQISGLRVLARQVIRQLELGRTVRRLEVVQEELAEAKQTAETASAAKTQFLASTSHEIRTPLHGIVSSLDLLRQEALSAESTRLLQLLTASADALNTLLNDILDAAKIEAGRMTLESIPIDVRTITDNVVRLFASRARDKGISLTGVCDDAVPDRVMGDPVRLAQVITNFVSNAIKFTQDGGVTVTVEYTPTGELRLAVSDTGIGMTESQLQTVFESFSQASDSTTRKYGGTGLGMYISDQLARLMGGRIEVASQPGVGTCFVLFLPVVESRRYEVDDPADTIRRIHGHVLVAEDNPVNQQLVRRMLANLGVTFDLVNDGVEAISRLETRHELILMDIQMPELDGVDATRRLRASGIEVPIVALTANNAPEELQRYVEAGMNGCLSKPYKQADLARALSRHLPCERAGD